MPDVAVTISVSANGVDAIGDVAKGLDKVQSSADGATQSTSKMSNAFGDAKTAIMGWAAGATAAVVMIDKVNEAGIGAVRTADAFRAIGGTSAGLDKLRQSTNGLVSDTLLMSDATRLLSQNTSLTTDQLAKMDQIGAIMGAKLNDVAGGIEAVDRASAMPGQFRALKEWGFDVEGITKRYKELKGTMSDQDASNTAFLEVAGKQADKFSGALTGVGSETDKLKASWGNFWDDFDSRVATGINGILGIIRVTNELANKPSSIPGKDFVPDGQIGSIGKSYVPDGQLSDPSGRGYVPDGNLGTVANNAPNPNRGAYVPDGQIGTIYNTTGKTAFEQDQRNGALQVQQQQLAFEQQLTTTTAQHKALMQESLGIDRLALNTIKEQADAQAALERGGRQTADSTNETYKIDQLALNTIKEQADAQAKLNKVKGETLAQIYNPNGGGDALGVDINSGLGAAGAARQKTDDAKWGANSKLTIADMKAFADAELEVGIRTGQTSLALETQKGIIAQTEADYAAGLIGPEELTGVLKGLEDQAIRTKLATEAVPVGPPAKPTNRGNRLKGEWGDGGDGTVQYGPKATPPAKVDTGLDSPIIKFKQLDDKASTPSIPPIPEATIASYGKFSSYSAGIGTGFQSINANDPSKTISGLAGPIGELASKGAGVPQAVGVFATNAGTLKTNVTGLDTLVSNSADKIKVFGSNSGGAVGQVSDLARATNALRDAQQRSDQPQGGGGRNGF